MEILEDHSSTCRIYKNERVSILGRWAIPLVKDHGRSVWMMCNDPVCEAVVKLTEEDLSGWVEEEFNQVKESTLKTTAK